MGAACRHSLRGERVVSLLLLSLLLLLLLPLLLLLLFLLMIMMCLAVVDQVVCFDAVALGGGKHVVTIRCCRGRVSVSRASQTTTMDGEE